MSAAAPSGPPGDRVRAVDWLRGLCVLVMIVAHALAFLSPAHDADAARGYFNQLNGLPGPAFIFVAGFALALVTARSTGDAATDAVRRRGRGRKSLGRIGQVLLASLVMRHVMWDSFRRPETWPWLDVLTCIALMLGVTWAVLFALPARRGVRFVALGTLAATSFAVAPWAEVPRTFGAFTTLLNNGPHANTWPLVPWAGYGWLGAIVGLVVGGSTSPLRTLARTLVALVGIGVAVSFAGPIVRAIDATVNPWSLVNAGERLWKIAAFTLVLVAIEARGVRLDRGPIGRGAGGLIALFSRQALVAYVTHLVLIYGYWGFRPLNRWLYAVDWPAYVGLALVVVAATAGACAGIERWTRSRGMPNAKFRMPNEEKISAS